VQSGELPQPDTLRNLATYLTLQKAREEYGFDPAKYGLTERAAADIAQVGGLRRGFLACLWAWWREGREKQWEAALGRRGRAAARGRPRAHCALPPAACAARRFSANTT
jgi:hypothetical protein